MKTTITMILLAMIAGCATAGTSYYKSASSGLVGCAPDDVDVTNITSGFQTQNWNATCKGNKYYCSRTTGFNANPTTCFPQGQDAGAKL